MKVVVDKDIPFIEGRFPKNVETVFLKGDEIGAEDVKDADALVVRTRTHCGEALLKGSRVKIVATATIGTDHIDIDWCEKNGITVKNAPGCNAPGVAQYVFSSLFKAGFDPTKQTLGIVGYGNVGHIVKDWADEMGISTLITDAPRKKEGLTDVEYHGLEEVLKKSDAVTLHVPLTLEGEFPTYHLIGEDELQKMKEGAILVNSSRGGVVDENSWKRAITRRGIKAIVDVWEKEPMIDRELLELSTVSTPHIAGYSEQGKKRATRMVLEAVGERLNIAVNTKGLECEKKEGLSISRELIQSSYDPSSDSDRLRENPMDFEKLRNRYLYRSEPGY